MLPGKVAFLLVLRLGIQCVCRTAHAGGRSNYASPCLSVPAIPLSQMLCIEVGKKTSNEGVMPTILFPLLLIR